MKTQPPGYRPIAKSCRTDFYGGNAPPDMVLQFGVVSLNKKAYAMSGINYAGAVVYDQAGGNATALTAEKGAYLWGFAASSTFLYDMLNPAISDYTNAYFKPGPTSATNIYVTNSTDLLNLKNSIYPKDIDYVMGNNQFYSRMDQPTIWKQLVSQRMIFSFHIPHFPDYASAAWTYNNLATFNDVKQDYFIPAGFDYLIFFPCFGLLTDTVVTGNTSVRAAIRFSLELST